MKKYKEFWISKIHTKNEVTPWTDNPVSYIKYNLCLSLAGGFWKKENTYHAIEHQAYLDMKDQCWELAEALEICKDIFEMNNSEFNARQVGKVLEENESFLKQYEEFKGEREK